MEHDEDDDLLPEYNLKEFLKTAVRGKYADRVHTGTLVVSIDRDVAEAFPDEHAVNEALRVLLKASRRLAADAAPSESSGQRGS